SRKNYLKDVYLLTRPEAYSFDGCSFFSCSSYASFNSSTIVVSVIFSFALYAARIMRWPDIGDVIKTNTIPSNNRMLTDPSIIKQYRNTSTKNTSTTR